MRIKTLAALQRSNAATLVAMTLLLIVVAMPPATAIAQTRDSREPTLRERLTAGLLARRPSEVAFVEAVVDAVDRGDLSERLVNRVFLWARSRPARSRTSSHRPIIRFEAALTRLAARSGVVIQQQNPG